MAWQAPHQTWPRQEELREAAPLLCHDILPLFKIGARVIYGKLHSLTAAGGLAKTNQNTSIDLFWTRNGDLDSRYATFRFASRWQYFLLERRRMQENLRYLATRREFIVFMKHKQDEVRKKFRDLEKHKDARFVCREDFGDIELELFKSGLRLSAMFVRLCCVTENTLELLECFLIKPLSRIVSGYLLNQW